MAECLISIVENYYTTKFYTKNGGGEIIGRVTDIQDFMHGYDYIIVRAPLWVSHSGAKGVGRKGCLRRVVPSHSASDDRFKWGFGSPSSLSKHMV